MVSPFTVAPDRTPSTSSGPAPVIPYTPGVSIHHLQLWVPDLGRAEGSWGWLLERLGYRLERQWDHGRLWRGDHSAIVIEASPDMVPGMLYSRLRPGMNHVAFRVASAEALAALVDAAPEAGWTRLADQRHPVGPTHTVAYLEDADGFEVELVAPGGDTPGV
jgi:catechol 2,3-dioxygenase-like lactoylglutathione lyase family enzyme